jgi:adenine-specific DNA-methyltransferase
MKTTGTRHGLVEYSLRLGEAVLQKRTKEERRDQGQYLTPQPVARFMASQLGVISDGARILEPAVGSGSLACAVVERALHIPALSEIWIEGYETDPALLDAARECLQFAVDHAAGHGLKVHVHLHEADFVQETMPFSRQAHLYHGNLLNAGEPEPYDLIIANPPYFKLKSSDPRVDFLRGHGSGHTNIYTVFLALCSRMLGDNGRACFITPRSFCSGAYFAGFRREFFKQVVIESLHLFESREDTFRNGGVLQENVIITFRSRHADETPDRIPASIRISASKSGDDLSLSTAERDVERRYFLGRDQGTHYFRLPVGELDEQILAAVDSWKGALKRYRLKVSTGPIVPFRARHVLLHDADSVISGSAAPLLWMNNVARQSIAWPLENGKPQAVSLGARLDNLLVPVDNYVLLRRFSAKEEARRLIAAPFLASDYASLGSEVGLENHLNYICRADGRLEVNAQQAGST